MAARAKGIPSRMRPRFISFCASRFGSATALTGDAEPAGGALGAAATVAEGAAGSVTEGAAAASAPSSGMAARFSGAAEDAAATSTGGDGAGEDGTSASSGRSGSMEGSAVWGMEKEVLTGACLVAPAARLLAHTTMTNDPSPTTMPATRRRTRTRPARSSTEAKWDWRAMSDSSPSCS